MTQPAPETLAAAWLAEGERGAGALDAVHSVLVIGRDTDAAAWIALGLARAQSARRRVAIADLVGEVGPIQALLRDDDDPHGIADSFLYGVSLNKIARPVDASGRLFVLPSGSEAVAVEEVFRSDRWKRLAGGFREVGALLVLVAQADTPGLESLATSVDGVVHAGDASGALPDAGPPLAVIGGRPRRARAADGAPDARPADERAATGAAAATTTASSAVEPRPRRDTADLTPPRHITPTHSLRAAGPRRWQVGAVVGVAAAALVAAVALFRLRTPGGDDRVRLPARDSAAAAIGRDGATAAATAGMAVAPIDSVRVDSVRGVERPDAPRLPIASGPLPALTVANPAEADSAAAYAVYLQSANTPEGASLDGRAEANTLPAHAVSPVIPNGEQGVWYRVTVGAYTRRVQAESLLTALRAKGVWQSWGVVRLPYALLLEDRVPAVAAPRRILALRDRGVTAYPLSRGDGTYALYAGAFETAQEAALLVKSLRAIGLAPTLVYRTGRSL